VAVVNEDGSQVADAFINQALEDVPVFDIRAAGSTEEALAELKLGNLNAYAVIPAGFGNQVNQNWQGQPVEIKLEVVYDESDLTVSSQIISSFNSALTAFARVEIPVSIDASPINIANKPGQMDFLAPGIIVFGLLIMIPTSARIMVRDKERGYLARQLTSPTRPWEFIAGYMLCLLLIAVLQIAFFILCGWALGMHIVGNLALAFLVFTLTAIASISIGMVVAAISKSENQAEPLTWLFAMPLAALSGVWFSMSFMPKYIQTIAGLFPFSHAVEAARAVLIRGAGFAAVQGELLFLAVWGIAATALGIFLFGRTMRS